MFLTRYFKVDLLYFLIRYSKDVQYLEESSALDPRFKRLPFLTEDEKQSVYARLITKIVTAHEKSRSATHVPEPVASQSVGAASADISGNIEPSAEDAD